MFTRFIVMAFLSATLMLNLGCSVNPATGTPDLVFMSEDKEIKIGTELHEKIMESTPIYTDEKLQAYIERIGQKIVKHSHRPDLKYTFTIIDSPDINAFALPGGFIYINRGLMSYLQSEAQLAAVLAHEVGHVTGRHSVKQDTARKGSSVVTVLSVLTTGSTVVGDVTNLWGTAAVMGYGREMELEADSLGAEYLFNMGYNPKAMIEVIGVLKDQERFARRQARESGKKTTTYHGVFSTHPRNDTRLQEVVAKAGELSAEQTGDDNVTEFRQQTEGMLFGINYQPKTAKMAENNTYSHSKLGFKIDFPKGWTAENQRNQILAKAPDEHAHLSIKVGSLRTPIAPDVYIKEVLKVPTLTQSEPFSQFGLIGHTGIKPATREHKFPTRIAVLYQNRRVYILQGIVEAEASEEKSSKPNEDANTEGSETNKERDKEAGSKTEPKTDDERFMASIRSFRPSRSARRSTTKSKTLHYVKANERTTFALLAKHVNLGKYTEDQLRLLNGYYPRGEPKPGEWIKIVK
ncbi:MAG: M48 family metalloprotease [Cellvibrionaceae bacterium]